MNLNEVLKDEIESIEKEREEHFRRSVRAKLNIIIDLQSKMAVLKNQLETEKKALQEMKMEVLNKADLL